MNLGSYERNLKKQNGNQTIFASEANIGSGFFALILRDLHNYATSQL